MNNKPTVQFGENKVHEFNKEMPSNTHLSQIQSNIPSKIQRNISESPSSLVIGLLVFICFITALILPFKITFILSCLLFITNITLFENNSPIILIDNWIKDNNYL